MRGPEIPADGRPFVIDQAGIISVKLDASHAGGLAARHAFDRRGNGYGDAACAASGTAFHKFIKQDLSLCGMDQTAFILEIMNQRRFFYVFFHFFKIILIGRRVKLIIHIFLNGKLHFYAVEILLFIHFLSPLSGPLFLKYHKIP